MVVLPEPLLPITPRVPPSGISKETEFNAGLPKRVRTAVLDQFMDDRLQVVVATIAFGMGVDKPNVRFVAHYDPSGTIEEYQPGVHFCYLRGPQGIIIALAEELDG